eukprot:scaffold212398_cov26-Prasinocladus_malaysianus.AAC.1
MLMLKSSRLSSTLCKSEATEAEAGSAAARTLVTGDFLGEIVALHRLVYGSNATRQVGTVVVVEGELAGRWVDAWARGYHLGQAMLRHCEAAGHRPPAE